jgi:hypothetical protein
LCSKLHWPFDLPFPNRGFERTVKIVTERR